MGQLRSPRGMMAWASSFLLTPGHSVLGLLAMMPWCDNFCCLDLRSFSLGGASHDTFFLEVFCFLVPDDLVSLGLGRALLLASLFSFGCSSVVELIFRRCDVLAGGKSAPALAGQSRAAAF